LWVERLEDRRLLSLVPSMLMDINTTAGADSNPAGFIEVGGTVFFNADDGEHGIELWKSDGTPGGTTLLKDINPGSASSLPQSHTVFNGALYFNAYDPVNGEELWKSDGTPAGTTLVGDLYPGTRSFQPHILAVMNGTMYLAAMDGYGWGLWKSDGTAAGTTKVRNLAFYMFQTAVIGNTMYFGGSDGSGSGWQLWRSDGTAGGTVPLTNLQGGPNTVGIQPENLTNVGGTLYFSATDADGGCELWKSDGTPGGTVRVADVVPGTGSSYPSSLANINGTLFYRATDGSVSAQLWTSDGTAGGTRKVKDINPQGPFVNMNGTAYFAAYEPAYEHQVWKTDGTADGTVMVGYPGPNCSPEALTNVNGVLYFTAWESAHGRELWRSDGTAAVLVNDIWPGTSGSCWQGLTNINGALWFAANDGARGMEPWIVLNRAPVANAQSVTTPEDTPAPITLTGSDPDGDALTFAVVGLPAHGTLSGTAPALTYTPAANYNGPDSFTFKTNDGIVDSGLATVTINVTAVNDPPVASDDAYEILEDGSLEVGSVPSVSAGLVLRYSFDEASSGATPALDSGTSPAANGTFVGSATRTGNSPGGISTGSLDLTPGTNLNNYVSDGNAGKVDDLQAMTATFWINLQGNPSVGDTVLSHMPVYPPWPPSGTTITGWDLKIAGPAGGGAPTASNFRLEFQSGWVGHNLYNGQGIYAGPLSANDQWVFVAITFAHSGAVASYKGGEQTSVAQIGSSSLIYNLNGWDNPADLRIGGSAHDPAADHTPPAWLDDVRIYDRVLSLTDLDAVRQENLTVRGVLTNDTDPEGGPLSAILVTPPSDGTVTLSSNGSFVYTPNADFCGTDQFTYKANDGTADSNTATATITVNPVNDPPVVVNHLVDAAVQEDAVGVFVDASNVFDDVDIATNGDQLTLTVAGNTNPGLVTASLEDGLIMLAFAANQNGSSSITLRAKDIAGEYVEDTFVITVDPVNDSPTVVNPILDVTVQEDAPSQTIDVSDVFGDVDIATNGDQLSLTLAGNTNPSLVTVGLQGGVMTLAFAANQNGSSSITLRATDVAGEYVEDTFVITVDPVNDPPVVDLSGPASGVRGQPRTFTFAANDPNDGNPSQTLSYQINWGDGTPLETVHGGYSIQAEHVFASSGTPSVSVIVTDGGGASSGPASQSIAILAAELQGSDLYVGGTTGDDTITLRPADSSGNVSVIINGANVGTYRPTGQIVVYAQAGNDTVQLQSAKIAKKTVYLAVSAILFGQAGADTLDTQGSTAANVLVGGADADTLTAGSGRDILLGGLGADILNAGSGDDLLLGATTDYDADLAALALLLSEWRRTDLGYQARINHLTGATPGGANGACLLNSSTVHNDAAIDELYGGSGTDWFLYHANDSLRDRNRKQEVATLL
jgi:ELWxxDGT repeat protein